MQRADGELAASSSAPAITRIRCALRLVGGALPGERLGERARRRAERRDERRATRRGGASPRAIAATSPCGTRKPVSPSRTDSRMPGEFDATTGVAHAAASRFVIPHPSFGDANTSAHERRSSESFSASRDAPKKPHPVAEVKRRARAPRAPAGSRRHRRSRARRSERCIAANARMHEMHALVLLESAEIGEERRRRPLGGIRRVRDRVDAGIDDRDRRARNAARREIVGRALADRLERHAAIRAAERPLGEPDRGRQRRRELLERRRRRTGAARARRRSSRPSAACRAEPC